MVSTTDYLPNRRLAVWRGLLPATGRKTAAGFSGIKKEGVLMAGVARNTRTIKKPLDEEELLPTYLHNGATEKP